MLVKLKFFCVSKRHWFCSLKCNWRRALSTSVDSVTIKDFLAELGEIIYRWKDNIVFGKCRFWKQFGIYLGLSTHNLYNKPNKYHQNVECEVNFYLGLTRKHFFLLLIETYSNLINFKTKSRFDVQNTTKINLNKVKYEIYNLTMSRHLKKNITNSL